MNRVRTQRGVLMLAIIVSTLSGADKAKTSDLLVVAQSRAIVSWRDSDRINISGAFHYRNREYLSLIPRSGVRTPLEVTVWVRGIPEMDLSLDDQQSNPPCPAKPFHSMLNLQVSKLTQVTYRYCASAESFNKAQGEIDVAAEGNEPERIPLSYEREQSFFESRLANALLSPMVAAAGGVCLGTVFGFLSFLVQQRHLRRNEQLKAFEAKKIEQTNLLTKFFTAEYGDYVNSMRRADDWKGARELRTILRKGGVYGILPPDEIRKINRICDPEIFLGNSRLSAVDALIRRNFQEFID